MIAVYLAACTKATEHEISKKLAEFAALDAFGIRCTLTHNEHGKPCFLAQSKGKKLFVSISHSHEFCLAAVSDYEIGADIEHKKDRGESFTRLAERYFAPDEQSYVLGDPCRHFYEIWCAKESYIKYTGEGFSRPLRSFCVFDLTQTFTHFTYENYTIAICSNESAKGVSLKTVALE